MRKFLEYFENSTSTKFQIKRAGEEKAYAKLKSEEHTIQGASCVGFHYAMYTNRRGCDIARFKVTLECENSKPKELFRTTDSGFQKWVQVSVDIPAEYANKKCQVCFTALSSDITLLLQQLIGCK